jgi:predicted flap endonuclease-1-like 5' DNA nuclease
MVTLVLQTILLLLAAYFIGYFAGYFFKHASTASKNKSAAARQTQEPVGAQTSDDLTRIKGIGPAIAKKLTAMDVRSYEQIAGWGKADIDRVNDALRFKGRIQREDWVGQAKVLATKG